MIAERVCIVGLGLMGGSLAKALQGQVGQLIGVDQHAATRQQVLAEGVVDRVTADFSAGVGAADLVILATPVLTILQQIEQLPEICPDGLMVIDLGSTKGAVGQKMAALPADFAAIGGHPMCGKEHAGYQAAEAGLFQGQTFVLARNDRTTAAVENLALQLVDCIGANPLFMDAETHDHIVAVTSHLPYLLSAELVSLAVDMADERVWPVSASGFRDSSRLAGSDPRMMRDILLTNKKAILEQLVHYQDGLQQLSELLAKKDEAALVDWLAKAQQGYHTYRQHKQP